MSNSVHYSGEIPPPQNPDAEMERYGITRVTVETFIYKSYRYTNLADALAQAELEHSGG